MAVVNQMPTAVITFKFKILEKWIKRRNEEGKNKEKREEEIEENVDTYARPQFEETF